jgi:hypothetical protein
MSKAKQSISILSIFQDMLQCGSISTVVDEEEEDAYDSNSILPTASSTSSTMFQQQQNSFPSSESLKEMMLPMMPRRQRTDSFSSAASIHSILLCGSVNDVKDQEEEPREARPTTVVADSSSGHGSKKLDRYVICLSPDKSKYMRHPLSQEHSELTRNALSVQRQIVNSAA